MSSLARRVALATALSIAATGLTVAGVAGLLLDRFAEEADRTRLRELAAATAAVEDEEEEAEPEDEDRDARLAAGALLAVYVGGRFVEGARDVPHVPPGRCEEHRDQLVCAVAGTRVVALAAMPLAPRRQMRDNFALATAIAVLVTSLLGTAASFALARWSLAPLARLRDAVGRVPAHAPAAGALGPAEGVAEVDALRAALVDAFERLGLALAQSDRFASDAAHELRTPLTTILGELELLHEDVRGDTATAAVVARVRATAGRLATLVERLLVMARAAGPAGPAERIDLGELVLDVVAELPAESRGRVRVEPAETVTVSGDRALLAALVTNAVENALKFSGDAEVRARVGASGAGAFVEVDDEGPGVAPEERERVFEPFRRGAGARTDATSGHGIGLALVAQVAAAHGGRAFFVDRAHGARLRVELPAAAAA